MALRAEKAYKNHIKLNYTNIYRGPSPNIEESPNIEDGYLG